MIATNAQTQIFLLSLLLGAVMGAVYDLFRILRIAFPAPALLIAAEDLLYFLFLCLFSFSFIQSVNYGQVRAFILIGEGAGFLFYYFSLGRLVMKSAKPLIKAGKTVLFFLWRFTLRPFFILGRTLAERAGKKVGKSKKKVKKVVEMHRKHLHIHRVLLYNYFKNRGFISQNTDAAKKREKRSRSGRGKSVWKRKRNLPKADC